MKNFSDINLGTIIFLLILVVFAIGILLTFIENRKIKKETFRNPESFDVDDAGLCFCVKELDGDKVLIENLHSGWDYDFRLLNTEAWVKKENIPAEFLVVGKMCSLSRNESGICFNDYYMRPPSNLFQW